MSYAISIVTMNRRAILQETLDAVLSTTETLAPEIYVTDNGSTDGTPDLLREYERAGKLQAWLLPENVGVAKARNAHWAHCIGKNAVKLDDKVKPLCPGWLTSLHVLSTRHHALIGPAYDPTVAGLQMLAPCLPFVRWDTDGGIGGTYLYVPGEASTVLGAWDELPGVLYGWEDNAYIQRARLLGWAYGFGLCIPVEYLAQANPASRAKAQEQYPIYAARLYEYQEAERDLAIPVEDTDGWQIGRRVRV